jgi:hypothetical protein
MAIVTLNLFQVEDAFRVKKQSDSHLLKSSGLLLVKGKMDEKFLAKFKTSLVKIFNFC